MCCTCSPLTSTFQGEVSALRWAEQSVSALVFWIQWSIYTYVVWIIFSKEKKNRQQEPGTLKGERWRGQADEEENKNYNCWHVHLIKVVARAKGFLTQLIVFLKCKIF